jgi:hypothetical protein
MYLDVFSPVFDVKGQSFKIYIYYQSYSLKICFTYTFYTRDAISQEQK